MVDKRPERIRRMFAEIAPRYDAANRVLSMRLDVGWRRHVARHLIARPGRVLDLAAGTGDLAMELERLGKHRVVAADFTFEMLVHARKKLAPGVKPVAGDALRLPFASGSFDGVAVAWGIRNFADPHAGLMEIHRVLVRGGALGVIDFSTPAPAVRRLYAVYFHRLVPAIGRFMTGSDLAYRYLPNSVSEFPEGAEFLEMMASAGFEKLSVRRLTAGIVSFYRGERA